MGAAVRRSSTLEAAEDRLEMLDLSRSISPRRRCFPGLRPHHARLQQILHLLRRPLHPRPGSPPPAAKHHRRSQKTHDAGGAREVTLLGQTINHYAYRHGDGRTTTFAELLYEIHEATPDLPRLRFVTSFPRDFSDDALAAMRDCPRICRYLHAPAQHGSDRILKLMNRGYTAANTAIFSPVPASTCPTSASPAISSSGFPTETDEDFAATIGSGAREPVQKLLHLQIFPASGNRRHRPL